MENLKEQLKKMHSGTELYSPVLGKVKLIYPSIEECPEYSYMILVEKDGSYYEFLPDGRLYDYEDAQQMLFISEPKVDVTYGDIKMKQSEFYYCETLCVDSWDAWLFQYCDDGEGNITSNRHSINCGFNSAYKFPKLGEYDECEHYYFKSLNVIVSWDEIENGEMRNLRKATPEEIEFMKDFMKTQGWIYSDLSKRFSIDID